MTTVQDTVHAKVAARMTYTSRSTATARSCSTLLGLTTSNARTTTHRTRSHITDTSRGHGRTRPEYHGTPLDQRADIAYAVLNTRAQRVHYQGHNLHTIRRQDMLFITILLSLLLFTPQEFTNLYTYQQRTQLCYIT